MDISKNEELHAKWGTDFSCSSARFSVSVPLRLQALLFEANVPSVGSTWLWKWKQ